MELNHYLPLEFRGQVTKAVLEDAEEIRLRVGQPLEVRYADEKSRKFGCVNSAQIREMLNYLSGYSVYAIEEELRQGFFTVEGGHRVGVSGRTSYHKKGDRNEMNFLSDINGINVRIAHERKECALPILPWIYRGRGVWHTFLFAPPGVGKTTYLRDCIRCLSEGNDRHPGLKVGVVDERSEIAACHRGVPQNDMGPRTDVLDNCPKELGMKMLLRSMSPEVIAVDELGVSGDFDAVSLIAKSGVSVLGTIHAGTVGQVRQLLCSNGVENILNGSRLVGLERKKDGTRTMAVYDGMGELVWQNCQE